MDEFHNHNIIICISRILLPFLLYTIVPCFFFFILFWALVVEAVALHDFFSQMVICVAGVILARTPKLIPLVPFFKQVFEGRSELMSGPWEPVFVGDERAGAEFVVDVAVGGLAAEGEEEMALGV